ncbi:MAG: hypothetical protein BWY71_02317 [Planctomycetes bacterium ADurb.Bin412]|nr:MAG: hypothetical protein BWY71_02317 [Planctomycetes bacterium ADurb.Bin412]
MVRYIVIAIGIRQRSGDLIRVKQQGRGDRMAAADHGEDGIIHLQNLQERGAAMVFYLHILQFHPVADFDSVEVIGQVVTVLHLDASPAVRMGRIMQNQPRHRPHHLVRHHPAAAIQQLAMIRAAAIRRGGVLDFIDGPVLGLGRRNGKADDGRAKQPANRANYIRMKRCHSFPFEVFLTVFPRLREDRGTSWRPNGEALPDHPASPVSRWCPATAHGRHKTGLTRPVHPLCGRAGR